MWCKILDEIYKNIKIHIYIKNKYVLKFHSERFNQVLSFNLNIILFCFFSIEIKRPIKKKHKGGSEVETGGRQSSAVVSTLLLELDGLGMHARTTSGASLNFPGSQYPYVKNGDCDLHYRSMW